MRIPGNFTRSEGVLLQRSLPRPAGGRDSTKPKSKRIQRLVREGGPTKARQIKEARSGGGPGRGRTKWLAGMIDINAPDKNGAEAIYGRRRNCTRQSLICDPERPRGNRARRDLQGRRSCPLFCLLLLSSRETEHRLAQPKQLVGDARCYVEGSVMDVPSPPPRSLPHKYTKKGR